MTKKISRRNLIKGVGAGALGLGLGARMGAQQVIAQVSPAQAAVPAYYRFMLGDLNMAVIKDASVSIDPTIFGANVPEDEVIAAVEEANVRRNEDGSVGNLFDIMMVQTAERNILMDTGLGSPNSALNSALESFGITPADVTDVIVTHFHPDHVGGLSFEGEIAYPNAQHYISQVEFDFLQEAMTAEEPNGSVVSAMDKMQPIIDNDQLMMYSDEDEVVPNIMAVATPGHTMGHHAMMIESNGVQLMNMVDAVLNAYLSVPNPTWQAAFDLNGEQAAETRVDLLGRVADEQIMVFGYHFPFPGVGFISRDGDGFRFTPASF